MATQNFNLESFANIVLRYHSNTGEERQIRCHKAILSTGSEYFRARLQAEGDVQDHGGTVIELHDLVRNDAKGFESLIKYIYTSQYTTAEDDEWSDHVRRARIAQQFGVAKMEDEALKAFQVFFDNNEVYNITLMLEFRNGYGYKSNKFDSIVEAVREKHVDELVHDPGYALITDDKEVMTECLLQIWSQGEMRLKCQRCGRKRVARYSGDDHCGGSKKRHTAWARHEWSEEQA